MRKVLGAIYLLIAVGMQPYLLHLGIWSKEESLPLHLCALSNIMAGITMFWPTQRNFEILFYWGISGGIHSILTPEITAGSQVLVVFEYYFLHINIIFAPVFLMKFYGLFPKERSWLTVFLITQIVLPVVGGLNWLIDANYMYLSHKPIAENPFIVGEWPWYILVLEVVMFAHFLVLYKLVVLVKQKC
jgi:hypothetical integral membrane protein (TIGR02206 family)